MPYKIKSGDSYWDIAKALYGGSEAQINANRKRLQKENGGRRLFAGGILKTWDKDPKVAAMKDYVKGSVDPRAGGSGSANPGAPKKPTATSNTPDGRAAYSKYKSEQEAKQAKEIAANFHRKQREESASKPTKREARPGYATPSDGRAAYQKWKSEEDGNARRRREAEAAVSQSKKEAAAKAAKAVQPTKREARPGYATPSDPRAAYQKWKSEEDGNARRRQKIAQDKYNAEFTKRYQRPEGYRSR